MKRVFLFAIAIALAMMSCDSDDMTSITNLPFPGKIAVITNTVDQNEEEFRSAEALYSKYGENKVIHVTWPLYFMSEQEQMVTTVARLGADKDIKAIIINQAVPGTNAAIDKLKETRDDIFIVYCSPNENPQDISARANLIMMPNEIAMGEPMVQQAKDMGAEVFVHYSFPRHMSQTMLSTRRDRISAECTRLGITFVNAEDVPDPVDGVTITQQYILDDVPKMIELYGKDTAFFSTNCAIQIALIHAVANGGAIYPQPCCPSPLHGFTAALGIETNGINIKRTISDTRKVLASKNELGRLSTWPVPASMLWTGAGVEYAIRWINGQVPKAGIDDVVLKECMSEYIKEAAGEDLGVSMTSYSEASVTYDNYKMLLLDYLTY